MLVFLSLFYVYLVGAFFGISVYPLRNRVTYYSSFDAYVISQYVDLVVISVTTVLWFALAVSNKKTKFILVALFGLSFVVGFALGNTTILSIIALLSIPAILSLIILDQFKSTLLDNRRPSLAVNYVAILGIGLGVTGIVLAFLPIFSISTDGVRNYQYDLFVLFGAISPVLMLLMISCLPLKLIAEQVRSFLHLSISDGIQSYKIHSRIGTILLITSMTISVILVLIPHQPSINIDNQNVGVDTGFYVNWVSELDKSQNFQEFVEQAFIGQSNGERPITLIILLALVKLVGAEPAITIEHFPLLLAPALVFSVYALTRELTSNDITSLLAAFITAVSYHTLIGIYAGFYANWLALVAGYLAATFLLKFLKEPRKPFLIIFLSAIILLHFIHTYTWTILSIVMGVFLLVSLAKKTLRRKSTILLLVLLAVVVVDVARVNLTGSSGGIERDIEIAGVQAGPEQFVLRWNNLSYSVNTFLGGLFSNFLVLSIGVFWLIRSNMHDTSTIFMIIFLSVAIIPVLFGDHIIQTRVLYNIPFAIPVAIALTNRARGPRSAIPIAVCLWFFAIAIGSATNFHLVPPA